MHAPALSSKITLALNKRIDDPKALLQHTIRSALSVGTIASEAQRDSMKFLNFVDADGADHPFISALSLIVMRGTSGELRKFGEKARDLGLAHASVTQPAAVEVRGTGPQGNAAGGELEYVAVMAFGGKPEIDAATGRLSLWR